VGTVALKSRGVQGKKVGGGEETAGEHTSLLGPNSCPREAGVGDVGII